MPPKKATAVPKKAAAEAAGISGISEGISGMSVSSSFKMFEMSFCGPFMIKSFVWNNQRGCQVDVFVPTLDVDDVVPNVSKDGLYLEVQLAVPEFFYEEARALQQTAGTAGVNANTHIVTAHQDVVQEVRKAYHHSPKVFGKPQRIKLPFKCHLDIPEWEVMNFAGVGIEDGSLQDAAGNPLPVQQYHAVLKVDLLADERRAAKKVAGRARIIQTP